MRPWLDLFRARLREPADLPTLVHELEQVVRAIIQPRSAVLWAPPDVARHWSSPATLPAYAPDDPLIEHFVAHPAARRANRIEIDSPAFAALDAGILVPLVSLGTFVGLIAIPEPELSADQIATLDEIAGLAASAIRVARLELQVGLAERVHQTTTEELRVAEIIQRSLLPESLPNISGWQLDAWYKPARVVGGDLYDIIPLPGDLLGIVLGDASDKSVPAALVMATVRTLIRAAAQRVVLPGQVLARANDDLCAQIPPGMFVTCFFAILDTASGRLRFANAGQCAPNLCGPNGVEELQASGWPLGMLPGRTYDEGEITLTPGSTLICFSDGLTETHDPAGEMFGTDRITATLAGVDNCAPLIPALLAAQNEFAGPSWEQEDDVTLISLTRLPDPEPVQEEPPAEPVTITAFTVPSTPDTERRAAERVLAAVADLPLTDAQRERLFTATAETVMNAAEHGNHFRDDLSVGIEVVRQGNQLHVRISDSGHGGPIPKPITPNIDAKLAGLQSPRGWGLFLIEKMVDQLEVIDTPNGHTIELTVNLNESTGAE
jgi:serine phosphatase RsbU (regulator of sigma subunit)/anti-sigma regulatory factor (Ser/Thr protein kinase)